MISLSPSIAIMTGVRDKSAVGSAFVSVVPAFVALCKERRSCLEHSSSVGQNPVFKNWPPFNFKLEFELN